MQVIAIEEINADNIFSESMSRITLSLSVGFATFVITFIAIMGYAMISFVYFSGPIPFAPYALPIPLFIGILVGVITFRVRNAD